MIVSIMGQATTSRGHKFTPRVSLQDLKVECYENTQIVIELIKIEIDFWKTFRESLEK